MLSKFDWVEFENQKINLEQTTIFRIYNPDLNFGVGLVEERILSQKEKIKANRFKFLADKQRFSAARVILKLLLKKIFDISLFSLDLDFSANGKPFFKDIQFNLAHSGNYVLIALGNKPVGIDVEIPTDDFDFDVILKQTFSAEEIRYINQNDNRKEKFLTLWTRKEALLKTTGEGLVDELTEISVLHESIERMGQAYTLTSFRINDRDIASVAHLNTHAQITSYQISSNFLNLYTSA